MSEDETEFAERLANRILEDASRDPDGDLSVLARQFLRARERMRVIEGRVEKLERFAYGMATTGRVEEDWIHPLVREDRPE